MGSAGFASPASHSGNALRQAAFTTCHGVPGIFSIRRAGRKRPPPAPPGQFALWVSPGGRSAGGAREQHAGRVVWVARDQGVLKSTDLPALPPSHRGLILEEKLISLVMPPALLAVLPVLKVGLWATGVPREVLVLSWASSILVCLPVGLWLGGSGED